MSEKKSGIRPKFLIGERVLWLGSGSGLPKSGQVRWIGRLLEIGPNLAVGLELDEPLPYGGIDGTWGTRRLFSCESKHGLIVPSSSVIPQPQHRGSLPSEKKEKISTFTSQLINKAQNLEERSPVAPRRRGPKTLPRQIKLFESSQTDKNGQTFRRMNREFRISEEHLETSSSISSRSCGSKRDRSSGIFSFFKWFKKDSRSFDSDDFDSPPIPGSPILKRGNGPVGSVDTLFSTATTNSFAFIAPSYYRPFGSANQPEIRIALGPETNTYKNRIKHLRKFEQNISLIEKYKLYESGTLPRSVDRINEIREYPKSESESKNSSYKRKKRKAPPPPLTLSENCLPEAQNKENHWKHRRALSEPEATTLKIHVKGKRKAPQPPVFKDGTLSLTRKKRPAPPPPKTDEISKIIKDASFEIIKSDTSTEVEVLSTDTLKLERGVLKPNKSTMAEPKYSPSSPVSPRPWYKRNTPKDTNVIWKLDKKKPREYNDTFLESGFPRKYNSGEKFVNIFSKVEKPEDKRKSQISILTNISELDREAAEIVKKNKEKEQAALAAVNKSFYPQAELDQMVHRVVLDEAEIRIVDNQIAKIEELDEYDRNTKTQATEIKKSTPIPVIQEASESSAKSTCSSASSSTYESTTSKPEIKYNGGLVWVCARCTLENCRWKITCAACDAWRPSPCEFREKTKTEEKTEKTANAEFLDKTSQLVENISKGLNMSKMMEKEQSLNQIDKQAEEVRLARLAFFDKQKNVESSESETKHPSSEIHKTENILFEKQDNKNLESTSHNQPRTAIPSELANPEKQNNNLESEKTEPEPEKVNNLTLNYKKELEKEKDVAKSIEECRQILQNIRVTQKKHKDADSKVVNTEEKVEIASESNLSDYSKITNCINAFPSKEVNKNDLAVPGTSKDIPGTSKEKVTNGGAIPKVKEIKENFKKPLPPLKITEENLKMENNKAEIKETSVQTTQVEKPKNVSQDIEESRRMLKEMLKEMKHSLPKRPESKKVKDEKPFQHSNDVAEAYLIESETIIEEIKVRKPSEKVSSSAQTSAMVRQIVPKVKPPSGAQIIVPMTVEEHQIKDGVLYTSVNKQVKKIGTATFELLRPRDFANIEAVKKNKAAPPLYSNVEPDELKTLSEQLTQPQGIANFKAELDDASAMNTMAVNRLLKRLESAIANGQLELAAVLAKELAQMKVNCSVTRQKPGPVSKHIVVELYIEDKHNHRGPFPLRVSPKMSLSDLKKQVEVEYDLPCDVQRWILGKNLANDDSATLESMGVDAPKTPIFLYLVVPEGKVQEVEEARALNKEEEKTNVDVKINLETKESPVVRDIPIQIINEPSDDEEDNEGVEEVSNPDIEVVEPITPLQDEAKQFPFGTLALGWKCKQCTLINRPTRVDCAACGIKKPSEYKVPVEYQVTEDEKKENYQKLMDLEKDDLIVPLEEFECPICLVRYESNDGVILRECLHVFCRACLANTVEYSEEAEVKCPYRDDIYTCDSTLLEREIKSLVTPQVYEGHLAKSIALAETKIGNTFHCKTPDCKGWCIYEDNVNLFKCPVCTHTNCLTCQAVHEGLNCKQYQEQVNLDSETNVESKRTKEMLQEMVDRGEAMNCPTCQVVLMKKWGCDWLRCSMCKTEICWITRGPRWGPNGKGDTTGGCQCGVNGIKCHPKCTYCH